MKKIVFLCLSSLLVTGVFAETLQDPGTPEKILKIFHQDFPEVIQPKIKRVGEYYQLYFKNVDNNSSCRILYTTDGKITETIRYYSCEQLSPFIRARIIDKFEGKDITGVTEITNESDHYYQFILEDSKALFVVRADIYGNILRKKKYKRE